MSYRPKGKHVTIDENNPEALAICDYTGFVFHRKDLVKQMAWRGDRLVWNGFLVGRPYADVPNPQLKPPILPPDPIPVVDPRPPQSTEYIWSTIPYTWNKCPFEWNTVPGDFDGTPALPEKLREQELNNFYWGNA